MYSLGGGMTLGLGSDAERRPSRLCWKAVPIGHESPATGIKRK